MKYITLPLLFMCLCCHAGWAADHIIFRNGQEADVKLSQVTDQVISYTEVNAPSGGETTEVPSTDVYMVYIEGSGNVYISTDGRRITGELTRANYKKSDVLYLTRGAEIGAASIRIAEDAITYTVKTSKKVAGVGIGLLSEVSEHTVAKSDVFMIRYKNGMRDIITPLDRPSPQPETSAQRYNVVFHAVAARETLNDIAARYQVTPAEIIEWNELSPTTKPTAPLTRGMQLMIYQPNNP